MSKRAPHRHDTPKHSKKEKKAFTKKTKRIKRTFKFAVLVFEVLMEVIRLIDRIRSIGG